MKGSKIGEFEELVLLSTGVLETNAYGLAIQKHLLSKNRHVNLSAVHAALNRLDEKGYLRSYLAAPTNERGGKRKRIYELTPFGVKALVEMKRLREQLWENLPDHLIAQIE